MTSSRPPGVRNVINNLTLTQFLEHQAFSMCKPGISKVISRGILSSLEVVRNLRGKQRKSSM